jgi:hypothetical protein
MRRQSTPRPFLVTDSDPKPIDLSEFTDEDLRNAFEQVPFDLDALEDEERKMPNLVVRASFAIAQILLVTLAIHLAT